MFPTELWDLILEALPLRAWTSYDALLQTVLVIPASVPVKQSTLCRFVRYVLCRPLRGVGYRSLGNGCGEMRFAVATRDTWAFFPKQRVRVHHGRRILRNIYHDDEVYIIMGRMYRGCPSLVEGHYRIQTNQVIT